MRRETASCGSNIRDAGRALERPKGKGKDKGKSGGKAKGKGERAQMATCVEGLDTPRGCAPVKDGLMTWNRTRLKERRHQ